MAGASLIFRYQWRAFWRRVLRTGRVKFYLTVLALLGWMTAVALPDSLSRAAGELAAGQTASMDRLLLVLCLLWLVVLGEDLNVSLSSDRLRRFPLDVRSLLALRLLSLFLSPIAWLATIVSLLGLSPLLSARHPAARQPGGSLLLCAHHWCRHECVSATWYRSLEKKATRRRGGTRRCGGGVRAGLGAARCRPLSASLMAANPATLVTTVAVATTPYAMAVPVATLLVSGAAVWYLLLWSFLRSLHGGTSERTARRATSIARLPGRLGPLVQKEQRSVSRVLDLWMGLLLVLAAAALSLSDFAVIDLSPGDLRDCVCPERQGDAELPWPGPTRRVDAIPYSSDSWEGSLPGKEHGGDGCRGRAADAPSGDWRVAVWLSCSSERRSWWRSC